MCRIRWCFGLFNANLSLASLALVNPPVSACISAKTQAPRVKYLNDRGRFLLRRKLLTSDRSSGSRLVAASAPGLFLALHFVQKSPRWHFIKCKSHWIRGRGCRRPANMLACPIRRSCSPWCFRSSCSRCGRGPPCWVIWWKLLVTSKD